MVPGAQKSRGLNAGFDRGRVSSSALDMLAEVKVHVPNPDPDKEAAA